MKVSDALTGDEFSEKDIDQQYDDLRGRLLVDPDGVFVVPVRHQTKPHFRRLMAEESRLGGEETADRVSHNECRDYIKSLLDAASGFTIVTKVFQNSDDKDKNASSPKCETPILLKISSPDKYDWFSEEDARISVSPEQYIQPDLAGRYDGRFAARPSKPSIIIEVIRTHSPEIDTMEALLRLSMLGHLVLFFIIPTRRPVEGRKGDPRNNWSKVSSVKKSSPVTIRSSYYLYGGEFYKNGIAQKEFPNRPLSEYAKFISNFLSGVAREVEKERRG